MGLTNERTTHLTQAEAWAIDDFIRHTWHDEGRPIGRTPAPQSFRRDQRI